MFYARSCAFLRSPTVHTRTFACRTLLIIRAGTLPSLEMFASGSSTGSVLALSSLHDFSSFVSPRAVNAVFFCAMSWYVGAAASKIGRRLDYCCQRFFSERYSQRLKKGGNAVHGWCLLRFSAGLGLLMLDFAVSDPPSCSWWTTLYMIVNAADHE